LKASNADLQQIIAGLQVEKGLLLKEIAKRNQAQSVPVMGEKGQRRSEVKKEQETRPVGQTSEELDRILDARKSTLFSLMHGFYLCAK
jgi:hypothetical protein